MFSATQKLITAEELIRSATAELVEYGLPSDATEYSINQSYIAIAVAFIEEALPHIKDFLPKEGA